MRSIPNPKVQRNLTQAPAKGVLAPINQVRNGQIMYAVLCIILISLLGLQPVRAEREHQPVMVELFTSQGCSSCPPADAILGELARDPDVLALSLPVDYWDRLGWKDTFAKPEFTARQQQYAEWRASRQVYTPQAIIDGAIDVIGSRRAAMIDAVNAQRAKVKPVLVNLSQTGRGIGLGLQSGPLSEPATIWIARYQLRGQVAVKRGENGGQMLDYFNVVTDLHRLGSYPGGAAEFSLAESPPEAGTGLAVFVQSSRTGAILGANSRVNSNGSNSRP